MSRIKCPNCKSTNTYRIMYGMPDLSDKLEAELVLETLNDMH